MNGWVIAGIEQSYRRTGVSFDQVYFESDIYKLGRSEILAGIEKGLFQKDPDGSVWVDLTDQGMDREVLLRSDGTSLYITQDIGVAIQRSKDWPFDRLIYVVGSEQRHHFHVLFKVLEILGLSLGREPPSPRLRHGEPPRGQDEVPGGHRRGRGRPPGRAGEARGGGDQGEGAGRGSGRSLPDGAGHRAGRAELLAPAGDRGQGHDLRSRRSRSPSTATRARTCSTRARASPACCASSRSARRPSARGSIPRPRCRCRRSGRSRSRWRSFPEIVVAAARELNPSVLTAYLFELCKSFSRYYQDHPVLRNEDQDLVHLADRPGQGDGAGGEERAGAPGDSVPRGNVKALVSVNARPGRRSPAGGSLPAGRAGHREERIGPWNPPRIRRQDASQGPIVQQRLAAGRTDEPPADRQALSPCR